MQSQKTQFFTMKQIVQSFCAALVCVPLILPAQNITFPPDSRVVDVTKAPYFAVGDGVTTATLAIQQALDDHPDAHTIIYLPDGEYLIDDRLNWPILNGNPSQEQSSRYTILQGQSRSGARLKLADNAPLYQNPAAPLAMINTGFGVAQRFRNAIHDITIDSGVGNPGAIGVQFKANNQGGIFNTTIISGDGQGDIGLDFSYSPQIGPLLVQDVLVDGFDFGVRTFFTVNSITFERLSLQNQNQYGFYNNQQAVFIHDLTSTNTVPAILNTNQGGFVSVINANLQKPTPNSDSAIINDSKLYARNITTSGYQIAINHSSFLSVPDVTGPNVTENTSHPVLRNGDNLESSLNLPIQSPPDVPWGDPLTEWVNIESYGAAPTAGDDSTAFQLAINEVVSSATLHTVYIPSPGRIPRSHSIENDVTIYPEVRRIVGTEARVAGNNGAQFIIEGNTTEPLIIERFNKFGSAIVRNSNRPLILRNCQFGRYIPGPNAGDLYLEDVTMEDSTFRNQNVWARQLNIEQGTGIVSLTNDGANLWILGLKTEKRGTKIQTINGGNTELIGAFIYSTQSGSAEPMFIVDETSNATFAGVKETNFSSNSYVNIVQETRNGVTRTFTSATPTPGGLGGVGWPLYVSYRPAGPNTAPTVQAGPNQTFVGVPPQVNLEGIVNDDGLPSTNFFAARQWSQLSGPGTVTFGNASDESTTATVSQPGIYELQLQVIDGSLTSQDSLTLAVFARSITTEDENSDAIPSGLGADADVRGSGSANNNYGANGSLRARQFGNFPAMAYVRFDVSDLVLPLDEAEFSLEVATTNAGLIEGWSYNVFGLLESPDYGSGKLNEFWDQGTGTGGAAQPGEITWNNAPARTGSGGAYDPLADSGGGVDPALTDFLGTVTLTPATRNILRLRTNALRDFINADTNGVVTFIISRVESANNSVEFASQEHPTFQPPTLSILPLSVSTNEAEWMLLNN
ncbi:MAG: glycosyl hydrolase family 28-related protein [Sumerlaeia bacterium]